MSVRVSVNGQVQHLPPTDKEARWFDRRSGANGEVMLMCMMSRYHAEGLYTLSYICTYYERPCDDMSNDVHTGA